MAGFQIVRIAFLVMTMALAVALVACSGAAGTSGEPGPAGPAGPAAETPDPTDTPTPTGEPGPVQKVNDIGDLVFHDVDGKMSTETMTVDVPAFFHPSDLMYSFTPLTTAQSKRIIAMWDDETNMLSVKLQPNAAYRNDTLTVKATDGTSSESISFDVRRNRKPMALARKLINGGPASDNKGAPPLEIWLGTTDEKMVMAKDLEAAPTISSKDIALAIGRPAANGMEAFFQDDAGNKLSFIHEVLSTADSKNLMVTDGNMKVTLLGMKTTSTGDGTVDLTTIEDGIGVHLLANDGHFTSDDSVQVLEVRVDTPPTVNAAVSSISTKVLNLVASNTPSQTTITAAVLRTHFKDDRQREGLYLIAWSEDDTIAEVTGNAENKKDKTLRAGGSDIDLVIIPQKPGTTTIMVKAQEPKLADTVVGTTPHANMGQTSSEVLVINVIVKDS